MPFPFLRIDGLSANRELLGNTNILKIMVEEFVVNLGMHLVQREGMPNPLAVSFQPNGYAGVTVIALIEEGHIVVRTKPEKLLVNIDISSCREFDLIGATLYWVNALGLKPTLTTFLDREEVLRLAYGQMGMN